MATATSFNLFIFRFHLVFFRNVDLSFQARPKQAGGTTRRQKSAFQYLLRKCHRKHFQACHTLRRISWALCHLRDPAGCFGSFVVCHPGILFHVVRAGHGFDITGIATRSESGFRQGKPQPEDTRCDHENRVYNQHRGHSLYRSIPDLIASDCQESEADDRPG